MFFFRPNTSTGFANFSSERSLGQELMNSCGMTRCGCCCWSLGDLIGNSPALEVPRSSLDLLGHFKAAFSSSPYSREILRKKTRLLFS